MAGNAIASGSAILTANADGLATGLGKAGKDITQWGHSTGATLKSSLAGGVGGGGGIGSAIGGAMMAIPGYGMAAGAAILAVGAAVGGLESKLEGLAKTNKMAGVLGVSASSYAGMQKVLERVGVEGNDVVGMFAKMGKNILTSSAAGEQFAKMGIDPKALAGQDLTEQFKTIAEGFTKIPRGAEQATAALQIFGKSGATLLPILQKGKAGIEDLIKGESFEILSDKQYATAGKAVGAWKAAKKDITGAWEGISDRLAVAFAPVVSFVSKTVSRIMNFVSPVLEWFGRLWEKEGEIIDAVFEKLDEWFTDLGEWFGSVIADLGVFTGGWPTIEEVVVRVFRAMGTAGGYAFDVLRKGMGWVAVGTGLMIEGFAKLIGYFKDLVSLMKNLPDKLKPAGLDGFIAGVQKLETGTSNAGKNIGAWGKKQADTRFGQGADDFNKWLDKALAPKPKKPDEGKPLGAIAADAATWTPTKLAGAFEKGSKEAYSIEMRTRYGEFGGKPDNDVHKDNGKKIDKNTGVLQRLEKRLEKIEGAVSNAELL